jgi:CPA2 family monovalent cation:H+ antiporter-2
MFSLGIEFSLKDLMGVKWIALVGGPIGIVLSTAMGMVVGSLLGWTRRGGGHRHGGVAGEHDGARGCS